MSRFWNALKAGVEGYKEAKGPAEYRLAGRPVKCPHCEHQRFVSGRALLNTAGREAFGVAWADPSATTLVCAECGRIEWFAQEPERVGS